MGRTLAQEVVEQLDPGVTNLVVSLNLEGFNTIDSGDGVSKEYGREPDDDGVLWVRPDPHVIMQSKDLDVGIAEAKRLVETLGSWGVPLVPLGPTGPEGGAFIQVMWSPCDNGGVIIDMTGITDSDFDWSGAVPRWTR